jgi:Zn-dependent peptidase ImmA (M78 family)
MQERNLSVDEFSAILKARELIREAGITSVPVNIEKYLTLAKVQATVRVDYDLPEDEAGSSTIISGRRVIFVNGGHSPERQRFTILHEVGHIVLGVVSSHSIKTKTRDLVSYRKKPKEEIICDVFAAEMLLPEPFFRKDVANATVAFDSIEKLAVNYEASLTSTGSRFAVLNEEPCAFILAEDKKVRYVSYSRAMRDRKSWISVGLPIPQGTLTAGKLKGARDEGPAEIEAYRWLETEKSDGRYLFEDVRLLEQWNQSLTLIWFEGADYQQNQCWTEEEAEEAALRELDGVMPWPSKRRRR